MVSPAVARSKQRFSPAPISKHRLLIVTDCSDRLRGWKDSMQTDEIEIEITSVGSSEELSRACHAEVNGMANAGREHFSLPFEVVVDFESVLTPDDHEC